MRIDKKYKVREVADQAIVMLQGEHGSDTTRVLSLNETSRWLWDKFAACEAFAAEDVAAALVERFDIDADLAARDAGQWIELLAAQGVIVE